jgi:hypothetical protein
VTPGPAPGKIGADPPGPTRRGLIGAALGVAGGGLLLAGCGTTAAPATSGTQHTTATVTTPPAAAAAADVKILDAALALERRTIAAYTAGIPLLGTTRATWAQQFLAEELAHAGELITLIKDVGYQAPDPAANESIGHPRDGDGVVAVLRALEHEQIDRYMGWIPQLSSGALRASVASIVACDAQHITALSATLGQPAITTAFPGGAT